MSLWIQKIDIINNELNIPIEMFDNALRKFAFEKYDEAICCLNNAINVAFSDKNNFGVSVFDTLKLMAKCYRWKGDFNNLNIICALLKSTNQLDINDDEFIFLNAHNFEKCTNFYMELFPDINARDCLKNNNFEMREKLLLRGIGLLRLGQFERAIEDFEVGYLLSFSKDDYRLQAETANSLGIYYLGVGNIRYAIEWFKKSNASGVITNSQRRMGISCLNMGICKYMLGKFIKAEELILSSISFLEKEMDQYNLCRANLALATVYRLTRRFVLAREIISKVQIMLVNFNFFREKCLLLKISGDIYFDEDLFDLALSCYQEGRALAYSLAPDGDLIGDFYRREGQCCTRGMEFEKGIEFYAKALVHNRRLGDRFEEGVVLRCLADGFSHLGDYARALEYIDEAITVLEEVDARYELAISRIFAGNILFKYSRMSNDCDKRTILERALEHCTIAQGIILELEVDHLLKELKYLQQQIKKHCNEEYRFPNGTILWLKKDEMKEFEIDPAQAVIAESAAMKEVIRTANALASFEETILLTGETGTGKELIAQLLHKNSGRKDKRMLSVNVSAIPISMFERELFGHVKGAFSGADNDKIGLASAANGGTLFLDEIGDLPLELQVKLLRLLQDGSYLRLGDPNEQHTNLRIIVASNKDLIRSLDDGLFRKDLYYRISDYIIDIPPIRERKEDILPLIKHYMCVEAVS